jgi:hypothetical protein
MPDIGWVEQTAAATFFTTRYGCSAWATIISDDQISLLTTAWNRILHDPRWTIPASPGAAEKAKLAYAQELTAWYMHTHIEDEDRRKGLQAQGVIQSGLVQETYDRDRLDIIPLPAEALAVLNELFNDAKPFYAIDVDRREPVGANQDVSNIDDSLNVDGIY